MKKKIVLSLLVIVMILGVTGCGKKKEEEKKEEIPQIVANQELGWIKYYVPTDFVYQPDLKGLAYTDNDRKIYTKGDYKDRNSVIIIDVIKQELNENLDDYIIKLNNNITGSQYIKTSDTPVIYSRERYEGKANEIVIYNYTYLAVYNGSLYNITVSGPLSSDDELYSLKSNILNTLVIGE